MNPETQLSTANISAESFAAFLKEHYDYPPEDSDVPLNEAFTTDGTYFGAIGIDVFSFDVTSGHVISNLKEVNTASITLEQISDPNSGVQEVFHNWLPDEISKKYAQAWLIGFVQTNDIDSLTPTQLAALVPICICTDDGTITDVGSAKGATLTASEVSLYRFILHSIKEGVYPWDHLV